MKKSKNIKNNKKSAAIVGLATIAVVTVVIAMISFSHFMVELFSQTIPSAVWSFFKEAGFVIVFAAVLIFTIMWFLRAIPHHKPKNYSIISFDVFGQESKIDGLRTEFKTFDVAWSFVKQYKKSYPLYNFALLSEMPNSEKKIIIRYIQNREKNHRIKRCHQCFWIANQGTLQSQDGRKSNQRSRKRWS